MNKEENFYYVCLNCQETRDRLNKDGECLDLKGDKK